MTSHAACHMLAGGAGGPAQACLPPLRPGAHRREQVVGRLSAGLSPAGGRPVLQPSGLQQSVRASSEFAALTAGTGQQPGLACGRRSSGHSQRSRHASRVSGGQCVRRSLPRTACIVPAGSGLGRHVVSAATVAAVTGASPHSVAPLSRAQCGDVPDVSGHDLLTQARFGSHRGPGVPVYAFVGALRTGKSVNAWL